MYRILDNNGNPLNVFSDQLSLADHNEIGFASFAGSKRALESVRQKLVSDKGYDYISFYEMDQSRSAIAMVTPGYGTKYKFFYRKLDGSSFWAMDVMSVDTYNCCQDLTRGIKMTEKTRKVETSGGYLFLPIYFLFKGSELFATDEDMHNFMTANDSEKVRLLQTNSHFIDVLYQKISITSKFPVLREWMEPLLRIGDEVYGTDFLSIRTAGFKRNIEQISRENKIFVIKTSFDERDFERAIVSGFSNHRISTGGTTPTGDIVNVTNLTEYLETFGDNLVRRAHERFRPLYTPGVDNPTDKAQKFFASSKYYSDLDYYAAQRDVVCSIAKGLTQNQRTLLVGEMGVGKTAITLASVYVHTHKKNPVSMVMCPGHMVEEWNKEINRLYPFAKTYIIENLFQLMELEPVIRNKKSGAPLFLIFGKDSCKMNYEERPYFTWDAKNKTYRLPNRKEIRCKLSAKQELSGLNWYAQHLMFFLKQTSKNLYAQPHAERDYAAKKDVVKYYSTEEKSKNKSLVKLWTAAGNNTGEWVKISKIGWVNKKLAQSFSDMIQQAMERGTEIPTSVLKAYDIAVAALNTETAKPMVRCNVSDYIRRRFKNCIDYFIADEVHLYSSKDTAQGKAFSNLVNTAKYTIALTGTLLNGYAENVFSMLFKLYSRTFIRNGFGYNDTRDFAKEYGVVETIRDFDMQAPDYYGHQYRNLVKTTVKYKPGVSPLLFSKFLLDKAVFVTLADITSDLPNYEEVPLGVEMDIETKEGYRRLLSDFRDAVREHPDTMNKFLFKTIQRANLYPDQPYNQTPIFNNDTGEQILCPVSIPRQIGKTFISNKDKKLLEIIQKHKKAGEKILVYVHWVNRLDCVNRVLKLLKENGINALFMPASVSARERQGWINKKVQEGIDVLICNPALVETGLNLLDFTTIVFYQMDDKLFTMRQASRRSLRLNQSHDVTVYILYFKDTVQENMLSLMANKLRAAMAVEGKFSEEGLNAIGDTDSILTQLANNLIKDIDMKLETGAFDFHTIKAQESGNRFKEKEKSVIHDWYYEVFHKGKKKPEKVDLSCDLEALRAG